jgi:hypothetical protein
MTNLLSIEARPRVLNSTELTRELDYTYGRSDLNTSSKRASDTDSTSLVPRGSYEPWCLPLITPQEDELSFFGIMSQVNPGEIESLVGSSVGSFYINLLTMISILKNHIIMYVSLVCWKLSIDNY